jgi:hypothetical protein
MEWILSLSLVAETPWCGYVHGNGRDTLHQQQTGQLNKSFSKQMDSGLTGLFQGCGPGKLSFNGDSQSETIHA